MKPSPPLSSASTIRIRTITPRHASAATQRRDRNSTMWRPFHPFQERTGLQVAWSGRRTRTEIEEKREEVERVRVAMGRLVDGCVDRWRRRAAAQDDQR